MAPLRTPAQALLAHARTTSLRRATQQQHTPSFSSSSSSSPLLSRSPRYYHATTTTLLNSNGGNTSNADKQDRETLSPRRTEGTRSGTDDQVASQTADAAFNPDKTAPEEARRSAERESNGSPLEASGANQELSRPKNEGERVAGGEDAQGGKKKRSGGSGGKKSGRVGPM